MRYGDNNSESNAKKKAIKNDLKKGIIAAKVLCGIKIKYIFLINIYIYIYI